MKYVVCHSTEVCKNKIFNRFTKCQCIEAGSEKEAILKYKKASGDKSRAAVCLGIINEQDQLEVKGFTRLFEKTPYVPLEASKKSNYLISRIINNPKEMTPFSLYNPKYHIAKSVEEALEIYESLSTPSQYPAICLGYTTSNDSFVVLNISDYVS